MHLLRYNKYLELRYHSNKVYAPLFEVLKQDSINTENQLMVLYDSICQNSLNNGLNTGAYVLFYEGGQLIISHIFQIHLLNIVLKVTIMKHAFPECL